MSTDPLIIEERRRKNTERARAWRKANPERNRENRLRWRRENPEKRADANRRYALAHPDKIREKWQRHQKNHPEKHVARSARYKAKNCEKVLAYLRAYFQTPEGKAARVNGESRRRARMRDCETRATTKQISELLDGATNCFYCKASFTERLPPTIDHVIPLAKGGAHDISNLVVACRPCNSAKGMKMNTFTTTGANVSCVAVGNFT